MQSNTVEQLKNKINFIVPYQLIDIPILDNFYLTYKAIEREDLVIIFHYLFQLSYDYDLKDLDFLYSELFEIINSYHEEAYYEEIKEPFDINDTKRINAIDETVGNQTALILEHFVQYYSIYEDYFVKLHYYFEQYSCTVNIYDQSFLKLTFAEY